MKVELVNHSPDPEMSIAIAGGISHDNEIQTTEGARDLIRDLKDWGHFSPFEFAWAQFKISDVSRSMLAQITRHRLASYMVESMRYVEQGNQWPVIPDSWKGIDDEEVQLAIDQAIEGVNYVYDLLLEHGVPKEDARFILPIGSKTQLYMAANYREFRHIFDLRDDEASQWEIQEVAHRMLEQLYDIAPSVFEDSITDGKVANEA